MVLRIPCTDIKLNDRAIRKRRDGLAKQTVTGQPIPVRPVIEQGRHLVILRRVRPVKQIGGQSGFLFVNQSRGDAHPARGLRHDGGVADLENHRRCIRVEHGIGRPRRALLHGAGRPVLPVLVGEARVHKLEGFASAVMFRQPIPASVFVVGQPSLPDGPLSLIGVRNGVDRFAVGILQPERLPPVAQHAIPAANDRLYAGVLGREDGRVCRNDEIAMRRHGCFWEVKPHSAAQRPALKVDRLIAGVVEFHKLLADILGRGVIMDFIDHHTTEQRRSGNPASGGQHGPLGQASVQRHGAQTGSQFCLMKYFHAVPLLIPHEAQPEKT